ncbi:hypothetical protein XPU_0777, partial [Xanthomonas arboricola pv. pruni str. MAFF 311562]
MTDALGGKSTYAMTNAGGQAPKISAITNGAGTVSYTYYDQSVDYRRRLSTMTDRRGIQTKHTYSETTENGINVSVHTVQEALGHPQQRTITTATATGSNKVLSIQLDGRKTTYTRNARLQPVLLTITSQEGQKRELAYTYCEASDVATSGGGCPILGYLKSIDGPRTDIDDRTTYNYYPIDAAGCETGTGACLYRKGDLKQTINAPWPDPRESEL